MKSFSLLAWASPVAAMLFAGCYPQGAEYIDEYDLVLTNYSPTFDFSTAVKYALPDSIIKIEGALIEGDRPDMVSPIYADGILENIRQNFNSRGWTEVDVLGGDPDVVILPSVFTTTNVSYYYDYWYWGWYYPPYGGWYYPGYYPTYVTYTTGTVMLQMTVPENESVTGNTAVVWTAALNGVGEGSSSGVVARVNSVIDQAFAQSAYLKH